MRTSPVRHAMRDNADETAASQHTGEVQPHMSGPGGLSGGDARTAEEGRLAGPMNRRRTGTETGEDQPVPVQINADEEGPSGKKSRIQASEHGSADGGSSIVASSLEQRRGQKSLTACTRRMEFG